MTTWIRSGRAAAATLLVAAAFGMSGCGANAASLRTIQPIPTASPTPQPSPTVLPLVGQPSTFDYADGTPLNPSDGQTGFIVAMATAQLLKVGFTQAQIDGSGLRIVTTVTPDAMAAAADGVRANEPKGVSDLHVATASVNARNGALLGFYAGQNYGASTYNWATAAQPVGSLFKVPALAMALSNGMTLRSPFKGNSPLAVSRGLSVHNLAQVAGQPASYGNRVSLLEGLQEALNTVFVDMTLDTPNGALSIADMAVAMGVPATAPGLISTNKLGQQVAPATISMGPVSVSPVDIANSYATVANNGAAHPWYVVEQVLDPTGKVLWTKPTRESTGMSPAVAGDVSTAMQQVVNAGTGMNAKALGRPVAGMTGNATSGGNTHVITAWFAGFTPRVSTAVVYLRSDPTTGAYLPLDGALPSYFGADFPTRTWVSVMKSLLSTMPTQH